MDRLHLAHTCTYDAGAVIKEAEALGELQQCQLLSQQQVRGNAAVLVAVTTAGQGNAAASVAVTTAGQGKCSSVGCCYNSRSGEMQQRQLLLQQQVRGNAAASVAVTTAGRVWNQEELPVRGSRVPEWHVGWDRNQATLQAAGETGANEFEWEAQAFTLDVSQSSLSKHKLDGSPSIFLINRFTLRTDRMPVFLFKHQKNHNPLHK